MVKEAVGKKKRVCIIGGGPSGLVSLRRVLESENLEGVIFEQRGDVGGVWNFKGVKQFRNSSDTLTNVMEEDEECWSSMYYNLTINTPYKYIELLDYPHPTSLLNDPVFHSFRSQPQMHHYFRGYADHFNLWPHIRLETTVTSVRPDENVELGPDGSLCRWSVTTLKDEAYSTDIFDAVMVCSGKNTYPYSPPLPGLETFQGEVRHTKHYESPTDVAGKRVVCMGFGPSSGDMALHLSKTAKSITMCHRFPSGAKFGLLPANTREIPNVKLVTRTGVIAENGEEVPCDVLIFGTGYTLKFPFFNDTLHQVPEVMEGKYVPHLYHMMVFTKRPSLAIINMCNWTSEVIMSEVQARCFTAILDGHHQLPPYEEMERIVKLREEELIQQNHPYGYWFRVGYLGLGAWAYFRAIAEEVGFAEEQCWEWPLLEAMLHPIFARFFGKLAVCRNDRLRIVDKYTWELEYWPDTEKPDALKKVTVSMDPVTKEVTTETTERTDFAANN